LNNHTALKAKNILLTLSDCIPGLGTFNIGGQTEMTVVICPEHYKTLHCGYSVTVESFQFSPAKPVAYEES
jgi:hypothetical protein